MRAQLLSLLVDDRSCARNGRLLLLHEGRVVAIANEADLLAVRLVGDGKTKSSRLLAHLGLDQAADRKDGTGELILRQREQEVRLVLARIGAALQQPPTVCRLLDPRIMACRDLLGAKPERAIEQRRKLQIAVAMGAGQRRSSGGVLPNEVGDDAVAKLLLEVDDIVGKANNGRDAARVVEIVERTAPAPCLLAAALVVQLHRQTNHVMTLLGEQRRGD